MFIDDNLRVELCARSGYTPLIGIGSISELVVEAKSKNIGALCLADFNTTAGFYTFEKECRKHDIKPIFGSSINVGIDGEIFDAVVIAKNQMGIIELNKFITDLNGNVFDYIHLNSVSRNLILILIVEKDVQSILDKIQLFDFIGITNGEDSILNQLLEKIDPSRIVEIGNSHYVRKCQKIIYEYLVKETSLKYRGLKALNQFNYYNGSCFDRFVMKNPKSLISVVDDILLEENIENFHKLDELMTFDEFKKEVMAGARDKYHPFSNSVKNRIEEELEYLKSNDSWIVMSYWQRICHYLHEFKQNYYLRGNGNSSVVGYCLGINNIDPIKYGLYYQSLFLPTGQQPDIDISVGEKYVNKALDDLIGIVGSTDSIVHAGDTVLYTEKEIANNVLGKLGLFIAENINATRDLFDLQPFDLAHTVKAKGKQKHSYVVKSRFDTFYSVSALFDDGGRIKIMDTSYNNLNNCFYKFDILEDPIVDSMNDDLCDCKIKYDYEDECVVRTFVEDILTNTNRKYFQDGFSRGLLNKMQPHTFKELAQIVAISLGVNVWQNNQDILFDKHQDILKVISTREDVIDYLVSCGMPFSEAFKASENIRKGLGNKNKFKPDYKIDESMKKVFSKIKYLTTRGYALEKTRCMLCSSTNGVIGD